jgi:hypothetical protein
MFDLEGTKLTLSMSSNVVKDIEILKSDGTTMFKSYEKKYTKK